MFREKKKCDPRAATKQSSLLVASEEKMAKINKKTAAVITIKKSGGIIVDNKRIDSLYRNIANYIHTARNNVLQTVNTEQVKAYWLIGRDIIEEEQKGKVRAEYGAELLTYLSARLIKDFGKGFAPTTLRNIRQFYLAYKDRICSEPRSKSIKINFVKNLSWTHYRILMREARITVRNFYEIEASKNNWSTPELERQMGSLLFERLAKSRDKKGLMELAQKGQIIRKPEDVLKDPMVLEFLDIPESHKLVESELEGALITHLQKFLLELGRGFAFVARQKRITLNGDHFYPDLIFYNFVLKNFLIIDLKTKRLTHNDVGQMQMYVHYFDREVITEGDNPTVGLILCAEKNDVVVQYTLDKNNNQIFASKYQFHFPTEAELLNEVKKEIEEFGSSK